MNSEAAAELLSTPAPKAFLRAAQRTVDPEVTLQRVLPWMGRLGITRLANVTGLDNIGVPVYLAIRPQSRSLAVSQGKGLTAAAAKVSALMESVEAWHAERVTAPQMFESRRELLRSGQAVGVDHPHLRPLAPVSDSTPMLWVEGWDLAQQSSCWAPWDLVSLNMVRPAQNPPTFPLSSNGLASGNVPAEAICHALCELIERDAVARWSRLTTPEVKARQVDLSTMPAGDLKHVVERIAAAGAMLALWDITSDLEVPAYAATVLDRETAGFRLVGAFSGFGAHLSAQVAAIRAVTEAVQSRLSIVSGSRDDLGYAEYERCRQTEALSAMRADFTDPPPALALRREESAPAEDFRADLQFLLARIVERRGGPVVVFDLSRPEVGIPVFRVVAPTLEPLPTWTRGLRPISVAPVEAP